MTCPVCRQQVCADPGGCRIVLLGMVDRLDSVPRRERDRSFAGVSCLTVDEYRTRRTA